VVDVSFLIAFSVNLSGITGIVLMVIDKKSDLWEKPDSEGKRQELS